MSRKAARIKGREYLRLRDDSYYVEENLTLSLSLAFPLSEPFSLLAVNPDLAPLSRRRPENCS